MYYYSAAVVLGDVAFQWHMTIKIHSDTGTLGGMSVIIVVVVFSDATTTHWQS